MHLWLVPFVVGCALGQPLPGPTPLAILPLVVGTGGIQEGAIQDIARAATTDRLGIELLERPPIGPERTSSCGGDAVCLADLYSQSRAASVLVVIVNAVAEPIVLSSRILDVATARIVAERYRDAASQATLAAELGPLIAETFDAAGLPRWAQIQLTVAPTRAHLAIGPVSVVPGLLRLPPGTTEIVATAEGYQSRRVVLQLRPAEALALDISLEESPGIFDSPWFWGVSGALLVAGGVVIAVLAWPSGDDELCLRRIFD